ncbi:hypothetical protein BJV82DRAFT_657917 [Fennellomyces sp. T-0311]|nr:hypothetical protein BJV82DRAFT_657917 [Fennellomyces sp. T-0311]
MYITYENIQYCIRPDGASVSGPVFTPTNTIKDPTTSSILSGTTIVAPDEPHPSARDISPFRPTFLIRTSDMALVPGDTAIDGYCALSYASSWMGDDTSDEAIDYGKKIHTLIDYGNVIYRSNGSYYMEQEQIFFDGEKQFDKWVHGSEDRLVRRRMTFGGVIQHLCRHFGIKYIWYDKMCIDKTNAAMKRNELRQMHQIYGNAQYTMAIVPEMWYRHNDHDKYLFDGNKPASNVRVARCFHQLITSQWSRRVWPFTEAMMSQKLLFVGRNIHVWSDTISNNKLYWKLAWDSDDLDPVYLLQSITTKPSSINVSTALSYIHRRQCAKPHDRVFALANLFPEFIDGITFSDTQPLLQLTTQFYRYLAAKDFSLLCFGRLVTHEEQPQLMIQQDRDFICTPSWTGVYGTHSSLAPFVRYPPRTTFSNYYSLDDGSLHITSSSITVPVDPVDQTMFEQNVELPSAPFVCSYEVDTLDQYNKVTIVSIDSWSYHAIRYSFGLTATHQIATKGAREYMGEELNVSATSTVWLSLTQDNCNECIVLSGVPFEIDLKGFTGYPVVKKVGDMPFERPQEYYTSIGFCFARNLDYLYSSSNAAHTFRII